NYETKIFGPDRVKVQVSMMPNGEKYFCIARAFQKRSGGFDSPESFYSIGPAEHKIFGLFYGN
ncbi:MAG: short-chain fatty acyl-CoA regulator family protein, partial [Flavobacteriaceae bacterium]